MQKGTVPLLEELEQDKSLLMNVESGGIIGHYFTVDNTIEGDCHKVFDEIQEAKKRCNSLLAKKKLCVDTYHPMMTGSNPIRTYIVFDIKDNTKK